MKLMTLFLTLALCTVRFAPAFAASPQQAQPASLYKRLGGFDALAAVTEDFIGRLAADSSSASSPPSTKAR